jgi:hypothetical protein
VSEQAAQLHLTKLDVAQRQLREAIRMFYAERDPIAIHTVAAAAHTMLHDLLKKKAGTGSFILDSEVIRPEYRKQFVRKVAEAENFFKHADRDPEADLTFRPSLTESFIFAGIHMFRELTGGLFREALLFSVWFAFEHPELLVDGEFKRWVGSAHQALGSERVDRKMMLAMLDHPGVLPGVQ